MPSRRRIPYRDVLEVAIQAFPDVSLNGIRPLLGVDGGLKAIGSMQRLSGDTLLCAVLSELAETACELPTWQQRKEEAVKRMNVFLNDITAVRDALGKWNGVWYTL